MFIEIFFVFSLHMIYKSIYSLLCRRLFSLSQFWCRVKKLNTNNFIVCFSVFVLSEHSICACVCVRNFMVTNS